MKQLVAVLAFLSLVLVSAGCGTAKATVLDGGKGQVEMRAVQSRVFDTTDKIFVLHSIMATLQDLGFVINDANDVLGTVSGVKMNKYSVKITVSVRKRGDTQLMVRASAEHNRKAVVKPEAYQDFFAALSKSMFLTAHQVD
jgi:hypothetical protein